jgi:hypothetical protein
MAASGVLRYGRGHSMEYIAMQWNQARYRIAKNPHGSLARSHPLTTSDMIDFAAHLAVQLLAKLSTKRRSLRKFVNAPRNPPEK